MKYTSNITDDNWTLPDNSTHLFSRGYTGHEHLDKFGLINMNGRLYDSKLGRFLSPDPFLQDPSNTQNFNRYSYSLNNPFAFTDPSGYVYGGAGHNYTPGGEMPYYNNPGLSNFKTGSFNSSWESDWQDNINNGTIDNDNICHLTGTGWNIRGSLNGTWSKQYIDLGNLGRFTYYTNSYSGAIRTGFRFTTISNESITYEWKGKTETYSSTCVGVGWAWITIMPHYGKISKGSKNSFGEPINYTNIVAGIAGEVLYSEKFGTWIGKDFKFRSLNVNGNGFTGGKFKFA